MEEVGAGRGKEKPHSPLMISVQKGRIRPGKGKGKSDGWLPQPLTHNTCRVCTDDPENKLPMHSLCPTREWEREWYGVTTPNIISGRGVILFPFGATPSLIREAEEVVAAEPLGAFNRDPNDLVLTVGGRLVVNHLLEHDFLSDVQLQSLLDDLDRVPLSEKAPIFNEKPPIVGRPQDSGTRRTLYGNYGGANHHKHNPHKLHDLQSSKGWQIVCWRRRRRLWWGVSDGAAPGGRVAKTVQCDGAVRCRGKVVAKCYGYDRAVLRAAHKDGLCVPCQEGEEVEGGEEEEVAEDPNGVRIEQSAQCLLLLGTTTGHFLLSGWRNGREVIAPLTNEEVRGVAGHPDQCPLAKVCHGEALPWPSLQGHVGIRVPLGCILVVSKGLYGGVARVAPEVEGVAQVVEWRQVGEYAAVTDFVWLRRMKLMLDDAKKEGQGMCPCHQV